MHIHAAKHTTKRSSKKFQAEAGSRFATFSGSSRSELRGRRSRSLDWARFDEEEARESFAVALEPLKANGKLNESHSDSSHITSEAGPGD